MRKMIATLHCMNIQLISKCSVSFDYEVHLIAVVILAQDEIVAYRCEENRKLFIPTWG